MSQYKLTCGTEEIELSLKDIQELDIIDHQEGYHILDGNKSFQVDKIIPTDHPKNIIVNINGSAYEFNIKDSHDLLVDRMGLANVGTKTITDIKSPMPGLILEIAVKEGDAFAEGDTLLILEAMKMENVIKAEADGIVSAILKKKADAVEKGEIIIELAAAE